MKDLVSLGLALLVLALAAGAISVGWRYGNRVGT